MGNHIQFTDFDKSRQGGNLLELAHVQVKDKRDGRVKRLQHVYLIKRQWCTI